MVIIPYQMLGKNPPKWNSFKPRLFKIQSLRKSLHLSGAGSWASREENLARDTGLPSGSPIAHSMGTSDKTGLKPPQGGAKQVIQTVGALAHM